MGCLYFGQEIAGVSCPDALFALEFPQTEKCKSDADVRAKKAGQTGYYPKALQY